MKLGFYKVFVILSLLFFLVACEDINEDHQHELRVENQYAMGLNIVVGALDYGLVENGEVTSYRNISIGNHTLGGDVNGTLTIEGEGMHKWTLRINQDGSNSIIED